MTRPFRSSWMGPRCPDPELNLDPPLQPPTCYVCDAVNETVQERESLGEMVFLCVGCFEDGEE